MLTARSVGAAPGAAYAATAPRLLTKLGHLGLVPGAFKRSPIRRFETSGSLAVSTDVTAAMPGRRSAGLAARRPIARRTFESAPNGDRSERRRRLTLKKSLQPRFALSEPRDRANMLAILTELAAEPAGWLLFIAAGLICLLAAFRGQCPFSTGAGPAKYIVCHRHQQHVAGPRDVRRLWKVVVVQQPLRGNVWPVTFHRETRQQGH